MSQSVYHIPVKDIKGQDVDLDQYQGKVLLIVNVASKCGLTPQYEGLEKLYQAKKDQGLEILGFPANKFLEQEPGTNDEIEQFCSLNYDVHFPLFYRDWETDRKSTRLNSSHITRTRMPSSA